MPLSLNKAKKWLDKHSVLIVIMAALAYCAAFCALSLWKYGVYGYAAFDLAYYHQIFWRTLHGDFFAQSFVPHLSLAYHVEPIIPALVPLYALFPDPRTLLILQSIAMALPALPIFLIAKHRLGSLSSSILRTALPLFFPFAWLLNPFVHAVNLDEFHLAPFALAPLFFAFLAYEKNKRLPFALLLAGALLVHESVAVVVIAFGVLAWAEKRPTWWMLFPALLGGAWHIFTVEVILRFNPGMALSFISQKSVGVTATIQLLAHIASPDNLILLLALGMPLFLMPFIRPQRLLLSALPLFQLLTSGEHGLTIATSTSATLLLPGIFLAAIEGSKVFPKVAHAIYGHGSDDRREAVFVLLTTAMIYGMVTLGPIPEITQRIADGNDIVLASAARRMTDTVAATDSVAAPAPLLPILSGRYELTPLPNDAGAVTEALRHLPAKTNVIIIDARATRHADEAPFVEIEP